MALATEHGGGRRLEVVDQVGSCGRRFAARCSPLDAKLADLSVDHLTVGSDVPVSLG